jgi:hypothetical protein
MGAFVLATLWHMLWLGGRPAMTALVPLLDARIFFELGNLSGVSIFFVVLAVYGLLTQLKRNKDLAAWTVMLFVAMFFLPVISPFSMFAIALFAACGVHELMTTTWDLELLQQSLLILIMCISLFLAITTVRERVADDPTPGFAHAMVTLRNQYHAGSVLTAPRYAPLIVSFTGRNASLPADANNDEIRTAFSRMPEEVYPFLNHTKTSYVLVTQDMRRDLLPRDDDGLLFLLQNTERFVNIDKNNETSLWFFISG